MNSKLEVYDSNGAIKLSVPSFTHTHDGVMPQDVSTLIVDTGEFYLHGKKLIISGSNTLQIFSTGRVNIY